MDRHDQESQAGQRRFRIWIVGRLSDGFTDGINGNNGIEQAHDEAGNTRLTGDLIDQSHIHGILDKLRRLGLEVLRFEVYQPDDQEPPPTAPEPPEPGDQQTEGRP